MLEGSTGAGPWAAGGWRGRLGPERCHVGEWVRIGVRGRCPSDRLLFAWRFFQTRVCLFTVPTCRPHGSDLLRDLPEAEERQDFLGGQTQTSPVRVDFSPVRPAQ